MARPTISLETALLQLRGEATRQTVKTAEVVITPVMSPLADMLRKLANEVRNTTPSQVTYADLYRVKDAHHG